MRYTGRLNRGDAFATDVPTTFTVSERNTILVFEAEFLAVG